MSLTAKEKNGLEIEPIPAGVYAAVCYSVIDLGTHPNPTFGNETHKVLIQWEVPEVRGEFERDGVKSNKPRAISKRYTLSLSEKANLRRDLESWRGRKFTPQQLTGFDLQTLLGAACQLQIVHETNKEGRTYATIAAIMALPKGMPRLKPENPLTFFSFEEAGQQPELPDGLPEWVANIVHESKEWRTALNGGTATSTTTIPNPTTAEGQGVTDDVPF
jgi:hypothetical protein